MIKLLNKMSKINNFTVDRIGRPFYDNDAAVDHIAQGLRSGRRTVVVEHFLFPGYDDDRVAYINTVRQPWGRLNSYYCYTRYGSRKGAEATLLAYGNQTLDECVASLKWGKFDWQDNHCLNVDTQLKFFCGYLKDGTRAKCDMDLALSNLRGRYDVVGLTEHLQATVELLAARFPAFFAGAPEILRTMKKENTMDNAPANCKSTNATTMQILATRSRRQMNDQKLYDEAALLFWKCHEALALVV